MTLQLRIQAGKQFLLQAFPVESTHCARGVGSQSDSGPEGRREGPGSRAGSLGQSDLF